MLKCWWTFLSLEHHYNIMVFKILTQGKKNSTSSIETVHQEKKASHWHLHYRFTRVILEKMEFQTQGTSKNLGHFGINSMSKSQNDMMHETIFREKLCNLCLWTNRDREKTDTQNGKNLYILLIFEVNFNRLFNRLTTQNFCWFSN